MERQAIGTSPERGNKLDDRKRGILHWEDGKRTTISFMCKQQDARTSTKQLTFVTRSAILV